MKAVAATAVSMCLTLGAAAAFAADPMKKDGMGKDPMPASTMSKDAMKKDAMAGDPMKKDGMAGDPMKKDGMAGDPMKKDAMAKDSMSKDGMKKSSAARVPRPRRECGVGRPVDPRVATTSGAYFDALDLPGAAPFLPATRGSTLGARRRGTGAGFSIASECTKAPP